MTAAHTYVTTTIPYVNARPHIGFALELVQADVLARFRRARGELRPVPGRHRRQLTEERARRGGGRARQSASSWTATRRRSWPWATNCH